MGAGFVAGVGTGRELIMARRRKLGWGASVQALGQAGYELFQAELAALGEDVSRTGRRLAGALALLAVALFCLFWALALALYLAVEVLSLWLPRWGATAAVLALALAVAAVLGLIGRRRLRRLETPASVFRRRWRSHRRWWQDQVGDAQGSAGDEDRFDDGLPLEDEP